MPDKWRNATVADLQRAGVLLVEDGNHGEYRPRPDEFVDDGVAFIRAADMDAGRVLFEKASRITEHARGRITKGIGAPGDILLSHKGTVGKVAFVSDDAPAFVCSPQTTFWRSLDPSVLDRQYLYAFLRSPAFQRQLGTRAGETDMAPYVSLTSQRGLSVTLPPTAIQRAIANILGTLDDKIELNRQINETLEAITRAVFKSWFVDNVMPGSSSLDAIADFLNGLALQKFPPAGEDDLPVIKIAELRRGDTKGSDLASGGIPPEYVVSDGDVLFSWSGSLEVVIWCGEKERSTSIFSR
jgi:type I restriction enzyme S subunit